MSTKLSRTTALAAACAVMMTAMCSCADGQNDVSGNYAPSNGHSNNNVIVTPDTEDYCEAPASADECETWKPAESS